MSTSTAGQTIPTLETAITFVSLRATQDDLDRIYAAAKQRTKMLRETRAAAITTGSTVRIDKIKPKYLSGLTGTVTALKTGRTRTVVTIELDAESTQELRASGSYYVPDDIERYALTGIPATCCFVQ